MPKNDQKREKKTYILQARLDNRLGKELDEYIARTLRYQNKTQLVSTLLYEFLQRQNQNSGFDKA